MKQCTMPFIVKYLTQVYLLSSTVMQNKEYFISVLVIVGDLTYMAVVVLTAHGHMFKGCNNNLEVR